MASSHHSHGSDYYPVGPTGQPQEQPKRQHHHHLHIPAASCLTACFRPSSAADRPPSPSLIRSPSAWIRAKATGGHGHGSGSRHGRRHSGDFRYDPRSYARNFDEGDGEGEEAELAAGDALKYRCFSSRLPASPPAAAYGKGKEAPL